MVLEAEEFGLAAEVWNIFPYFLKSTLGHEFAVFEENYLVDLEKSLYTEEAASEIM